MGRLIDDLLAFSRVGRSEMRRVALKMNSLVQQTAKTADRDAPNREIVWKIETLPDAHADPELLRLVLINLLSNAVKYTRTRAPAIIEVGCLPGEHENVFFVRDNGVGFDMRYVEKLFGVFQRLHSSAEFEGTGIGLANVRRIINRHGGRTWAEGTVDRGATFYSSLPNQPQHSS
jgi:light-regulated signal transduction histidine kinase (bacteriophytochrome)